MGLRLVPRSTCAIGLVLGAASCSDPQPDEAATSQKDSSGLHFPGQVRDTEGQPQSTSAPFGAHLQYFGGRVVSNIQVVQVLYGAGNYIPQVTSTGTPSMASFYQGVLNSP